MSVHHENPSITAPSSPAPRLSDLGQQLFASIDLDLAGGVPLVTDDLDSLKRKDSAFALTLVPPPSAEPEVSRATVRGRISATVDLFLDRIEPLFTGDFVAPGPSSDLVATRPAARGPRGSGEELVTVDRILDGIDIVMDVHDLLAEAAASTTGSLDVPPGSWSADVPVQAVPLHELPRTIEPEPKPDVELAPIAVDPAEHSPASVAPVASIAPEAPEAPLTAADEARLLAMAKNDLAAARFDDAHPKLERLARTHPDRPDLRALFAWARFALAPTDSRRLAESAELARDAEEHPFCPESHEVLGQMFLALGRPIGAVRYLSRAVELAPERSDLVTLLRDANEQVEEVRRSRKRGFDVELGEVARPATRAERMLARTDLRRLPVVLAAGGVLVAVLFFASVVLELGRLEEWLDPSDGFFWARRALLLFSGLLGARVITRHRPILREDVAVDPSAIATALVTGALLGALLPVHVVRVPMLTLMVMSAFHVIAEEAFFRVMLGRALGRVLVGAVTPAVVSGFLYAIYQLTGFSAWAGVTTAAGLMSLASMMVAGTIYAALHLKTRSIVPAIACHLTAALVVAFASAR